MYSTTDAFSVVYCHSRCNYSTVKPITGTLFQQIEGECHRYGSNVKPSYLYRACLPLSGTHTVMYVKSWLDMLLST